jgi:uncharacterized cupin superfamily protein
MSIRGVVAFGDPLGEPVVDHPRPERRVRGDPERRTWNLYDDPAGRMSAGIWACAPGAWRVAYAVGGDEYCLILEGRVRLTDEAGDSREFGPGDAFVIPGGFTGIWETLAPLRKHYVILSPPA